MRARRVIAAAMLALTLASCGSGAYTSKTFGFSAVCPEGWTVEEDAISVWFGTPAESSADDFLENVSYSGADALTGTLDDYVALLVEGLSANSANYTELSRESASIAGLDAVVLTYTCTSSQTPYVIKQRMFLLCDGTNVYNLVYTAHTESFNLYAAEAAAIAESFQAR